MRRGSRISLIAISVLAALFLVASSVAWWLLTSRLMAQATAWQTARLAEGYTVTSGPARRAGWPLRAEIVLPALTIATGTPGQADALAWRTDQMRLVSVPWRPGAVAIMLDGNQTVQVGAAAPVGLVADMLDIVAALPGTADAGTLTVTGRHLRLPLANGEVRVATIWLRYRDSDAQLSLTGLALPSLVLPFGGVIAGLELHARSTTPVPAFRDPKAALAAWRNTGGRLKLDDLSLRWGKLDIGGHATLGLDLAMQPEGAGLVRLTGFAEAIEGLARSGAITRNDARVATTLLGLLSENGADGVPHADLPLTLHDRVLSTGTLPLLRLRPISLP
jgi:hypothetical protein